MASKNEDPVSQPADIKPKRRKVAFSVADTGIEANACIKLHLVSTPADMEDSTKAEIENLSFNPEYMEQFVGEDGKIYGYEGLKIDVWLNALSFHAYVDIHHTNKVEDSKIRKRTNLTELMKRMFGSAIVDRTTFINGLSAHSHNIKNLISKGEVITREVEPADVSSINGNQNGISVAESSEEIVRLELSDPQVQEWHACLVPLILFLVEGSQPIEHDDPQWEIYVKIKKDSLKEDSCWRLLGFCAVYRFYRYPDSTRLRISQILVLPPYQNKKYGLGLLEAINKVAVERDCYDVTVEDPSESLQELRDCMDTIRLISFAPVLPVAKLSVQKIKEVNVSNVALGNGNKGKTDVEKSDGRSLLFPPKSLFEEARKHLKINKKQFKRCWEILLFICLEESDSQGKDTYNNCLKEQIKSELFDKPSEKGTSDKQITDIANEYDAEKSFVMFRSNASNVDRHEKQLSQPLPSGSEGSQEDPVDSVLEERLEEIKDAAERVCSVCKRLQISLP